MRGHPFDFDAPVLDEMQAPSSIVPEVYIIVFSVHGDAGEQLGESVYDGFAVGPDEDVCCSVLDDVYDGPEFSPVGGL